MGACGCGDYAADFKLPGPDGIVYAIEVRTPCDYCSTPAGVVLHRFTATGAKEWGADKLPEFVFPKSGDRDYEDSSRGLAVVDPSLLWAALVRAGGDALEEALLEDDAEAALREAVAETRKAAP